MANKRTQPSILSLRTEALDDLLGNIGTISGEQIEDSGDWEKRDHNEYSIALFVQPPKDGATIKKMLSVHFVPNSFEIAHANLDGNELVLDGTKEDSELRRAIEK